jgi:aminoglycoside phosphotransferase family enzyme/predicted kinase
MEMTDDIAILRNALLQSSAYSHAVGPVVHLETHISHVFLAGDYAYKIKKPVNFGFLDFTTLDKRRAACEDEVRLNRRLAPGIYLGVVPVCRQRGRLALTPHGCGRDAHAVEYAVQMRRMPQDGLLDRLAAHSQLQLAYMTDIAQQVADFHDRAARGPEIEQYGHLERISAPVMQNFEQTAPFIGRVVTAEQHRTLRAATEANLAMHSNRFAERVRAHRIVDGHGDLHLRNMCLMDGRVVIFDCIEFNPALRAGDVMSDIAFLTMDLDHRRLPAHANRFLNEYLEHSHDYTGLPLLDFYQAYRACVRAKVSCFELEQDAGLANEARAYFNLAERYFLPRTGGILITCGVSGSGKTSAARAAVQELGGVMVRSDAVRKHLAGVPLMQRGDAALYTPAMTVRTYTTLLDHARTIVASGRWAIVDAVHARRNERLAVAALAHELQVPFGTLYCEAPHEELVRRLEQRTANPNDISDADVAVLEQQLGFFETPTAEEGPLCTCPGGVLPPAWRTQLNIAH